MTTEPFNGFGLQKADPNVVTDRHIYVGGSDVPTILGINRYKTQFELAREKVGIVPVEFKGNEYTAYGNELEPQIRNYINTINNMNFLVNTYHDEERSIRSNVDGYEYEHNILLEIKTYGVTPTLKSYEAQMQLYLAQTGAEVGWLALYARPENFDTEFDADRLKIKEVERDETYIQQIYDAIETFWVRCEYLREQPDMTEQEFMTVGTDMDKTMMKLVKLAPDLIAFEAKVKEMKAQEAALKDELYKKMEENNIKKLETPLLIVTRVLPTKVKGFDKKGLQANYPDIYAQYETETEKRGYIMITQNNKEKK